MFSNAKPQLKPTDTNPRGFFGCASNKSAVRAPETRNSFLDLFAKSKISNDKKNKLSNLAKQIIDVCKSALTFNVQKKIHKQSQGSLVCGVAYPLNQNEVTYRNALLRLRSILEVRLDECSANNFNHRLETFCRDYASYFLGNDLFEDDLIALQSMLQNKNSLQQLESNQCQRHIGALLSNINNELNKKSAYFNSGDFIYTSLTKIAYNEERLNEFESMASDFLGASSSTALGNAGDNPPQISSLYVHDVQNNTPNIFTEMSQYALRDDRGVEYVDANTKFAQKFAAKIDIITFLMKNCSPNIQLDFQLKEVLTHFLLAHPHIIATLQANEPNIMKGSDGETLGELINQSMLFFDQFRKYGIVSREKTHFNIIVYDQESQQFKLINSMKSDDTDTMHSTESVIRYLESSKWRGQTFVLQNQNALLAKAESHYHLYASNLIAN